MSLGYAGASHATVFRCYNKGLTFLPFSPIILFCSFEHPESNHSNCKISGYYY